MRTQYGDTAIVNNAEGPVGTFSLRVPLKSVAANRCSSLRALTRLPAISRLVNRLARALAYFEFN